MASCAHASLPYDERLTSSLSINSRIPDRQDTVSALTGNESEFTWTNSVDISKASTGITDDNCILESFSLNSRKR